MALPALPRGETLLLSDLPQHLLSAENRGTQDQTELSSVSAPTDSVSESITFSEAPIDQAAAQLPQSHSDGANLARVGEDEGRTSPEARPQSHLPDSNNEGLLSREELPKPLHPRHDTSVWRTILKDWRLELLGCFGSLLALIAIYVLLSQYNHRPSPSWPHNATLNTLVQIFATIFEMLMLFANGEALSQVKWLWFDRSHPMSHVQRFDDASRGISGSLRILKVLRFKHFAVLGALVMIISIGTDPFIQQSVQYRGCNRANPRLNSSVPIGITYAPPQAVQNLAGASGPAPLDLAMQGAISDGILNPGSKNTGIVPLCQTGNCTFPMPYLSLAVCGSCTNTIYGIKSNCSITPPDGSEVGGELVCDSTLLGSPSLSQTNYTYKVNRTVIETSTVYAAGDWYNIARFNVTSYTRDNCKTGWQDGAPKDPLNDCADVRKSSSLARSNPYDWYNIVAASCEMHYCLKTYKTNVASGAFNESVVLISELGGTAREGSVGNMDSAGGFGVLVADPCYVNGSKRNFEEITDGPREDDNYITVTFTSADGYSSNDTIVLKDCVRFVSAYGAAPLVDYFQHDIGIDGGVGLSTSDFNDGTDSLATVSFASSFVAALYGNGTTSMRGITDSLNALAEAMTTHIRRNDPAQARASGIVYDTVTCVKVEWAWLAFPSVLLVMSSLFLACTIWASTRQNMVWKSSIYPLMFQALQPEGQADVEVGRTLREMELEAKVQRVILPRKSSR